MGYYSDIFMLIVIGYIQNAAKNSFSDFFGFFTAKGTVVVSLQIFFFPMVGEYLVPFFHGFAGQAAKVAFSKAVVMHYGNFVFQMLVYNCHW
jgi:hypothetical protein